MSQQTVALTIHNKMTSDPAGKKADAKFDLPVVKFTADFMHSGVVRAAPEPVPSLTVKEPNNGGIFISGYPSPGVEGVVGYQLPDQTNIAVIYFDTNLIMFLLKPTGTELDDALVKEVATKGLTALNGAFAIGRTNYNFQVTASAKPLAGTLNATVEFTAKLSA